jgi:hypothetical protein
MLSINFLSCFLYCLCNVLTIGLFALHECVRNVVCCRVGRVQTVRSTLGTWSSFKTSRTSRSL